MTAIELCDICGEQKECVEIGIPGHYFYVYICQNCLEKRRDEFL